MRRDSVDLEEKRVGHVGSVEEYGSFHERHRLFPGVLASRGHRRVIDIAGGVGVVGRRIRESYSCFLVCNDGSPSCLRTMKKAELDCTCFDIDNDTTHFPFRDKSFDAVIALATIEHVINVDRFVTELGRVLSDDGFLYISAPSYSGLFYVLPLMLNGKTFHDPMKQESKYEFYAHVRYFTYETLLEYVSSFGFTPDTVYLALPEASSKFVEMKKRSKAKAWLFRLGMSGIYRALGARWASEPVICFRKGSGGGRSQVRKVIL